MLTCSNVSSIVVDRLCHKAGGKATAVACFRFDFASLKEQLIQQQAGSSQWIALLDCRTTKNFYSYEQDYRKKM